MVKLIRDAHIHLLPSKTTNGYKIKLLIALFAGRHCLVNSVVERSTSLSKLCLVSNSKDEIADKIRSMLEGEVQTKMARNAFNTAATQTWDEVTKKVEGIYDDLLYKKQHSN
jgi:glycosyltransferase involved in cell wall biosynthesis